MSNIFDSQVFQTFREKLHILFLEGEWFEKIDCFANILVNLMFWGDKLPHFYPLLQSFKFFYIGLKNHTHLLSFWIEDFVVCYLLDLGGKFLLDPFDHELKGGEVLIGLSWPIVFSNEPIFLIDDSWKFSNERVELPKTAILFPIILQDPIIELEKCPNDNIELFCMFKFLPISSFNQFNDKFKIHDLY